MQYNQANSVLHMMIVIKIQSRKWNEWTSARQNLKHLLLFDKARANFIYNLCDNHNNGRPSNSQCIYSFPLLGKLDCLHAEKSHRIRYIFILVFFFLLQIVRKKKIENKTWRVNVNKPRNIEGITELNRWSVKLTSENTFDSSCSARTSSPNTYPQTDRYTHTRTHTHIKFKKN